MILKNDIKNDVKKTWNVMKEIIEESNHKTKFFPSRITIDKEEIFDQKTIAQKFNEFFISIGPRLSKKFSYLQYNTIQYNTRQLSAIQRTRRLWI